VRYAPILKAIADEHYDQLVVWGLSAGVHDTKTGYHRFVINDESDIPILADKITGSVRRFIAVDADYEDCWREIFPDAVYTRYRLAVGYADVLRSFPDTPVPDDIQIVRMDESWDDLVTGLFADDEFPADSLKRQLRENLSLGLMWQGKRAGFHSMHLNGEMGPLWIAPEARGRTYGSLLIREYMRMFLKENSISFALVDKENEPALKIINNLGIRLLDKDVLHVTLKR